MTREDFEAEAKKDGLGVRLFMKEFDRMKATFVDCVKQAATELGDVGISNAEGVKNRILEMFQKRGILK